MKFPKSRKNPPPPDILRYIKEKNPPTEWESEWTSVSLPDNQTRGINQPGSDRACWARTDSLASGQHWHATPSSLGRFTTSWLWMKIPPGLFKIKNIFKRIYTSLKMIIKRIGSDISRMASIGYLVTSQLIHVSYLKQKPKNIYFMWWKPLQKIFSHPMSKTNFLVSWPRDRQANPLAKHRRDQIYIHTYIYIDI